MMTNNNARLPTQQSAFFSSNGGISPEWYRALTNVTANANRNANLTLSGDVTFIGPYDTTITLTGTTTITLPVSGVVASLSLPQTWSAVQSFDHNDLALLGSTSGSLILNAAAVAGSHTITFPAGTTDFTGTGGTSDVVRQTTLGGPLTVGQLAFTDISGVVATGQISGAYSGITGVGTIATGVWNGTLIGPTYGGTGVNNGANTLTVSSPTTVGQGQYLGTGTNDNATAGYIGEYFEPTLASGSAITLVSGAAANVISQTLGPGDWEIFGSVHFTAPGTSGTNWAIGICTTTNTLPTTAAGTITASNGPFASLNDSLGPTNDEMLTAGPGRLSVATATTATIYLVARAVFVGTAETAYGYMSIRRVR